eukprot:UN01895
MSVALLLISTLICSFNAKSILPSWKDCSASNDKGTITSVTFNNGKTIPFGQNITIVAVGTTSEALQDPSYDIHIKEGAIIDQHINGDGCKDNSFIFPLSQGAFYWQALKCPIEAGSLTITLLANIASSVPPGTATSITRFYDQAKEKGNEVVCIEVDLVVTKDAFNASVPMSV